MSEPAPKSFRFVRNVGWNLLGYFASAAAAFLITPYLVRSMGIEVYGLYILFYTVVGYAATLSLGASAATVKYVAEFRSSGDQRGLADALRQSAAVHALGGAAAAAALSAGARLLAARVLHVPPPLLETGVFVMRCAAAGALLGMGVQFGGAVFQGLQRFELSMTLNMLHGVLMPAGAAWLISRGLGLRAVVSWYVALSAALCAFAMVGAWVLLRGTCGERGRGLPRREFMDYSLGLWTGQLAWLVTYQFDRLFVARGASIADLTFYSVPAGLLQRLQVLSASISAVLSPMMSELTGAGADEDLRRIYVKSVRFLLWLTLPPLVLLFAFMPQFLGLWLGPQFADRGVWPARWLVLAQACASLAAAPNSAMVGRGRAWHVSAFAWAQAVLSLVLWRALIPRFGIVGAAAGAFAAQALPVAFYVYAVHRRLALPLARYAREGLLLPCGSALLLALFAWAVHARASSWSQLVGLGAAGAALYYGSTWYGLSADDRALLRRFLRWES